MQSDFAMIFIYRNYNLLEQGTNPTVDAYYLLVAHFGDNVVAGEQIAALTELKF